MTPEQQAQLEKAVRLVPDTARRERIRTLFHKVPRGADGGFRISCALVKAAFDTDRAFDNVAKLLETDWRDLLMTTSFGYDVQAHVTWIEQLLSVDADGR